MAKQLNFEYKGTKYTLEFTRKTVQQMERGGFIFNEISDKLMTGLPALFAGSFLANHKFAKRKTIDEIFNLFSNKELLLEKLIEMYNEPFEVMIDGPEEEQQIEWKASF